MLIAIATPISNSWLVVLPAGEVGAVWHRISVNAGQERGLKLRPCFSPGKGCAKRVFISKYLSLTFPLIQPWIDLGYRGEMDRVSKRFQGSLLCLLDW